MPDYITASGGQAGWAQEVKSFPPLQLDGKPMRKELDAKLDGEKMNMMRGNPDQKKLSIGNVGATQSSVWGEQGFWPGGNLARKMSRGEEKIAT